MKLNKPLKDHHVKKIMDVRMQTFKNLTGRNPDASQREVMKKEVIDAAKRVERENR